MRILAIDLSTGRGTIAWLDSAADPFEAAFANDRKHSGLFFGHLQQMLQRFGMPDLIAVGLGPGSYAGTRIAIATGTGLQAVTGARLVGVSSLRALETGAENYCVIGDARRQSFFFARVSQRECVEGPLLYPREELLERLRDEAHPVFASERIDGLSSVQNAYPSARVLAEIAGLEPHVSSTAPLEPIYLRDPHITQPKSSAMSKVTR